MQGGDSLSENKSFDCAEDYKLTFDLIWEMFDPRLLDILL